MFKCSSCGVETHKIIYTDIETRSKPEFAGKPIQDRYKDYCFVCYNKLKKELDYPNKEEMMVMKSEQEASNK